jgi:hypothetical protein
MKYFVFLQVTLCDVEMHIFKAIIKWNDCQKQRPFELRHCQKGDHMPLIEMSLSAGMKRVRKPRRRWRSHETLSKSQFAA